MILPNFRVLVGISDVATRESPYTLSTVLGSCIGICLYDPVRKIGSLAHAMLPCFENGSRQGRLNPKRYVDTLLEIQLQELAVKGVYPPSLLAKVVGGANVFSDVLPVVPDHVGEKNRLRAMEVLAKHRIRIVGTDVGLTFGRKVDFDLSTGLVSVRKVGGGGVWKEL